MSFNPKRVLPNPDDSTNREKPSIKRHRHDDCMLQVEQPVPHVQYCGISEDKQIALNLIDIELPAAECASAAQLDPSLVDGSGEVDLLCFGMLCDVQIQLSIIRPENLVNLKSHWSDNENFKIMSVFLDSSRCAIQTEDATTIASLNLRTFSALTAQIQASSLYCIGLIRKGDLEQGLIHSMSLRSSQSHKLSCSMDMIICGPRNLRDALGRNLSKSRLFLQHPRFIPDHKVYDNPHYLGLPGSKLLEGAILPPLVLKSITSEPEKMAPMPPEAEQVIEATEILNHIAVPSDLKETEVDEGLIKTDLLRHQKEGINFILRRESLASDDGDGLWRRHYSFETEPLYYHKINGARSPVPRDSLGGILADDMGLGKTLTMICAIVSSLHQGSPTQGSTSPIPQPCSRLIPSQSTLVVVPTALLMDTWIDEINKHVVEGKISYYKYHGPMRHLSATIALPHRVILTTYATVATEFSRGGGVLERFYWHRLVLDEAHTIRNASTKQFKSIMNLSSNMRWCMTGTPIQNSIDDLGSLLKFLRIPFLEDTTTFRKYIIGQTAVAGAISRRGLDNLKLLLGVICIRRSAAASNLAPHDPIYKEIRVDLTPAERIEYATLGKFMKQSLDAAVSSPKSKGASQAILRGILNLRQFCNNGEQVLWSSRNSTYALDDKISILEQSSETVCALCQTSMLVNGRFVSTELPHLTRCDALICVDCLPKLQPQNAVLGMSESTQCTVCGIHHENSNHLAENTQTSSNQSPSESQGASTSKLLALASDVIEHHVEEKSIIFTYWISTLNIIERIFRQRGISFRRVDGTLSTKQRTEGLTQFHQDPTVRVLMMTLGTGAEGLNDLSVASRLHLVEPQWNPSVENQAIGRVVRLGQDRKVTVIRYVTNDTIEESVQSRQLQKLKLALDGGLRAPGHNHNQTGRAAQLKELESLLNISA